MRLLCLRCEAGSHCLLVGPGILANHTDQPKEREAGHKSWASIRWSLPVGPGKKADCPRTGGCRSTRAEPDQCPNSKEPEKICDPLPSGLPVKRGGLQKQERLCRSPGRTRSATAMWENTIRTGLWQRQGGPQGKLLTRSNHNAWGSGFRV